LKPWNGQVMTKSKSKKGLPLNTSAGIAIEGSGKYPLVHLSDIQIVERPQGDKTVNKLFYNPRIEYSFDVESLNDLIHSIRVDGLQQAPIVRSIEEEGVVTKVELIAGERRIRSCLYIFENDLPV